VIRVYDEAGNVIETHEHTADFDESFSLEHRTSHMTACSAESSQLDR